MTDCCRMLSDPRPSSCHVVYWHCIIQIYKMIVLCCFVSWKNHRGPVLRLLKRVYLKKGEVKWQIGLQTAVCLLFCPCMYMSSIIFKKWMKRRKEKTVIIMFYKIKLKKTCRKKVTQTYKARSWERERERETERLSVYYCLSCLV